MKAYTSIFIFFAFLFFGVMQAQRGSSATVTAQNYDISDNLDLQAVASVFGESNDLEDFERRLNDPSLQLSNLDLNNDGYVDYLRVIEVADGNNRVVVIQSVLGQDTFQDVATIEIERQRQRARNNTNIHVQIVGNPFLYGPNYIYEPYFYRTPVFFDYFWMSTYRPYFSPWYWGYYPTYFNYWAPMNPYNYHRHVHSHINSRNRFVYTDQRRMGRADRIYGGVSRNAYERTSNSRSFASRNNNVSNRYALENSRGMSRNNNGIINRSESANFTGRGNAMNNRSNSRSEVVSGRSNSNTSRSQVSSENLNSRSTNFQNTGTRVRSDFQVGSGRIENNRSSNNTISTGRSSNTRIQNTPARSTNLNTGRSSSNQRIERTMPTSSSRSSTINTSSSRSSSSMTPTSRSSSSSSISRGTSSNVSRSSSSSMGSSRGMSSGSSRGGSASSGRSSR